MFQTKVRLIFILLNLVIFLEVNSLSLNGFTNKTNKQNNKNYFDKKSELLFVHVIYRHGDRSPTQQSPGDPYNISYWPDGWGQLTNIGKRQHYELGKWFRYRYYDFLSPLYKRNEIYVQSTDFDRTLMSALSNLAGLYTPELSQIWNPHLLWQPIPVHTQPTDTEYITTAGSLLNCSSYMNALKDYQKSPEYLAELKKAKPIFDNLSTETNSTVDDFGDVFLIRDSWVCETAHNLTISEWAAPYFPNNEEFYQTALMAFTSSTATPHLAKYYSGFLLKDILDRLTSKVAQTLDPDRKFWMYSTHDSTVFGFLKSLGVFDNKFPGYAATIIVELRSYKNENYVKLFYKNEGEAPYVIKIPGCGHASPVDAYACPLKTMYKIYDSIIPKLSFDDECKIDE